MTMDKNLAFDPQQFSIAEQWKQFEAYVMADNFNDEERKDMRAAFYAGCAATLALVNEILFKRGYQPNVIVMMLGGLSDEIRAHTHEQISHLAFEIMQRQAKTS